ncbi:nucleotidyltransferase domain-containing protein [uncultured Ilyobacter sp.]|uniref:type VII toxin-antitoxin system MntA family adenylyltransferase antitoxin n=1 Tax=uncultured Ilyobacter sp. TaxID=544433 RepID=UPI0029C94788|nr:nucleotidyltransferase domain-containing protein [uncultured Ilyobacter sp.]
MSPSIVGSIMEALEKIDKDFVYIFGSVAKGIENENSDIDIAFYSQNNYDPFEIFMLAQNIGKALKREVDLIQLKNSSTVFQKEVVENGILIYEKDTLEREKFEILVLKKYARLNEERREIIKDYGVDL